MSYNDLPPAPDLGPVLNRRYMIDLLERIFWTFAQAFGMFAVASGIFSVDGITDLSLWQKAALSALAATLAALKGIVARGVGSPNTAATLPAVDDTPRA